MPRIRAKQPLESFDPRFMQLLIAGTQRRMVIPFLGPGMKTKAHLFQRRLHALRNRMRQEDHEHATLVTRTVTRLFWGKRAVEEKLLPHPWEDPPNVDVLVDISGDGSGLKYGAVLVLEPVDARFEDVLQGLDLAVDAAKVELIESDTPLSTEDILSILDKPKDN